MILRPFVPLSLIYTVGCITNYDYPKGTISKYTDQHRTDGAEPEHIGGHTSNTSSSSSANNSSTNDNGDVNNDDSSENSSEQNNGNNSSGEQNNSEHDNSENNSSSEHDNGENNSSSEHDNSDNSSSEHDNTDEDIVDCEADYADPAPINECLSDDISDGDVIEMSMAGGTTYFNQSVYSQSEWYCSPLYADDYSSAERTFSFVHPGGFHTCSVELESPCDDLTLVVIRWDVDALGCPSHYDTPHTCDWSNEPSDDSDQIQVFDTIPTKYMIVVDSATPTDANFKLSITCN